MAEFFKKQSVGAYFNLIAAVAGIVGIVAAVICSKMTVTYSLGNLGTIALLAVCGIALAVLAICLPNKFGNHDIAGTCAVLGAIALFAAAFGNVYTSYVLISVDADRYSVCFELTQP